MGLSARRLSVDEMVALNNQRRLQLNEENLKYYEDMLVYLRMSPVPQQKAEEVLLEMLDHLRGAQGEGRTARDVFGDDPQRYCEEIVRSMERQPLFSFSRYAFIFLTVLYVGFFVDGLFRLLVYPLLERLFAASRPDGLPMDLFVIAALGPLFVEGIMFFMRLTTFKSRRKQVVLMFFFQLLLIGVFVLWNVLLREAVPVLPVSAWASLGIGLAFWLLHKGLFKRAEIF